MPGTDIPSAGSADRGGPVAAPLSSASPRAASQTRTVERALDLLALVCEGGAPSLSECARRSRPVRRARHLRAPAGGGAAPSRSGAARRSQLPASTALRLLRTLEVRGFVRRDADGTFNPGIRVLQVGALALGRESLVRLST